MRRPNTVKVGPYTYKIQLSPEDDDVMDAADACGNCNPQKEIIRIHSSLPPRIERSTVVHELCHAITDAAGLRDELGHEDEEKLVRRLEPWLLALIVDNPSLISWLQAKSSGQ